MSIKTKSISKVLAWDMLANFFLKGMSFITVPIFTRLMQPSDYGQIATFSSWTAILSIFIGLGTEGAIPLAKIEFDEKEFNRFNSSVLFLSFLSFVFFFTISIIVKSFLSNFLGFSAFFIPLMVIVSFASYCISYNSSRLVQLKKTNINSLISVCTAVLSTLVAIIVLKNTSDIDKYIPKICIDSFFTFVVGLTCFIYIWIKGRVCINTKYWKFCLTITIPLIFHSLAGIIFNQSDRIMLKAITSETDVGLYSLAYNMGLIISIIWISCNRVWSPYYFEYKKNEDNQSIKEKSNNYMIFFTIMTLGFICLAPEVFNLLAPENYMGSITIIPIIAMAYYFNFIYSFPANYEFYYKKTKVIAVGTVMTAIVNIILNLLLIPSFASFGAALATLFSYMVLFLFHEINVRFVIKAKNYDYSFFFYLKGIIPVLIMLLIYYITLNFWYIRWGIAFVLGAFLIVRVIKNKTIF